MADTNPDELNYIPLVPYTGSSPTGGDSLTEDLNIYYQVSIVLLCEMIN